MKFGKLKSQIETLLTESYGKKDFKNNMFVFNELIVKNKNLSKLFYLYGELNSNKGLNESIGNEFINQSVVIYENTLNKIKPTQIKEIQMWVGHIQCENEYKHIDDFFTDNVTDLVSKIKSKNTILETLTKPTTEKKDIVKVPLKSMVEIANKTISDHLSKLSESDLKEMKKLLSKDDKELVESFLLVKGSVLGKLEKLQEGESDKDIIQRINETIEKVKEENFDRLSYVKLHKLNENL